MKLLNSIKLGQLIYGMRESESLTQKVFAKKLGIAQTTLSLLETGHPNVLAEDRLLRILEVLRINPEEAFDKQGPETKTKYCPAEDCPGSSSYVTSRRWFITPTTVETNGGFCPLCGTPLKEACKCGQSFQERTAFCGSCGGAYIEVASNTLPTGSADLHDIRSSAYRETLQPKIVAVYPDNPLATPGFKTS